MKRYMVRIDYTPKEDHPNFGKEPTQAWFEGVGERGIVCAAVGGVETSCDFSWYARTYGFQSKKRAENAAIKRQHDEMFWYAKYSVEEFDV